MNIADRIQSLRKSKGISQEEFADKIGVSRQSVSKWESEQSVPDIDKVIIMSDFFEVTTDYILKGIETEKQAHERPLDATIFVYAATFFNFIGLVIACAIWHETQTAIGIGIGLVFMALGCMVFGVGCANSTLNREKAKRLFWIINIWFLAFVPLSCACNALFSGMAAPYPIFGGVYGTNIIAVTVLGLVYIAICLSVVFVQAKIARK